MNRRREQGKRSREEILDAASRIMSQRGFEGTSISAISKEAGLPNSSIYWHFESKSEILAAVMERGASRFFADSGDLASYSGTPVERLQESLRGASASLERHQEFLRILILLLLTNQDERVGEVVTRVRTEGRQRLHEVIRRAFLDEGEQAAAAIADQLVDFALASFDGTFIAVQFNPALVHRNAMDKLAASIASLGEALLPTVRQATLA